MQIREVNIRNFMGIESVDLSVNKPINIFVGENEAGKSSLRDAILWCLTGQARGLKTHQDQAALIREGAKFAEVRIALGDGRAFIRRKTPKSPATETGFGVEPELPISPDILCDPYVFLLLPEHMRRQMFFALLPGLQPTAESIFGKLSQDKRFEPFNTADCRKIVEGLAQVAAKAGFPAAEKEAVTRRREAKRAKDTLGQVKEPEPEALIGDRKYNLASVDTENIERTLREVQEKRDELVKAKGQHEGDQARAQATKDRLEKLLSSVKGRLPSSDGTAGIVAAVEVSLTEAKERQKEIVTALAEMRGVVPAHFPETCPVHRVKCPNAGTPATAGIPSASQVEIDLKKEELDEVSKVVAKLEVDLAQLKVAAKAVAECQEIEKALLDLDLKLGQSLPLGIEDEIAQLDARTTTGHSLLNQVSQFLALKKQADEAKARLVETEQEALLYDCLAKAFAPDGIPSQMIAEAIGPMNELLGVVAAYLFPGRTLEITDKLDIELSGAPFITLSKSTKFRVGVAFQYALAKLAGARLLMIDEADILDPINRAALLNFLVAARDDFDTVMVFATSTNRPHKESSDGEVQFWWLDDGKVGMA